MEHIRKKLKSERGVTILFALLAFLVASMVSIVIVEAAATSVKRVHNDKSEQQAYLILSSAAELIRDEIKGMKCTISYNIVDDLSGNPEIHAISSNSVKVFGNDSVDPTSDPLLGNMIKVAVENLLSYLPRTDPYKAPDFIMSLEGGPVANPPKVKVGFTMQPDKGRIESGHFIDDETSKSFMITMTFDLIENEGDTDSRYRCYLNATLGASVDIPTATTDVQRTVEWHTVILSSGANGS